MNLNSYNYFRDLVQQCRLCYIGGAYVGKTALAVRLAQDFHNEGYRIWANIKVEFADPLDKIFAVDHDEPSCIILEHAELELFDESRAQAFWTYVSSRNIIVLMPSAGSPHKLLCNLECQVHRARSRWYTRCLPQRWQQLGLECNWHIPGIPYGGSQGRFRWPYPEEVHGLYESRDPGSHTYMTGYSPYVWQNALEQTRQDPNRAVSLEDFELLTRPGQLFMLCQWLHSRLVILLALKQATEKEQGLFRQNPDYRGSIRNQQLELQEQFLGTVLRKFLCVFDDELTDQDRKYLEDLRFYRNALAHCFFSLYQLEEGSEYVSYAEKGRKEEDPVWALFVDDEAARARIQEFLQLGECFHRLCRSMNIDYDRIL